MRIFFLFAVLLTRVCPAQTSSVCRWLSTGSASDALGGPVTVSVHVNGPWDGTCRFTRESGDKGEALEIAVGKDDTHSCPRGSTKLTALGNEAAQCRRTDAEGQSLDTIAGRMRQVYFVVNMTNVQGAATSPAGADRARDPYAASLLEHVAEEVVGNLY